MRKEINKGSELVKSAIIMLVTLNAVMGFAIFLALVAMAYFYDKGN